MTERLFVYGTLAPGQPNEHVLKRFSGTWEPAIVRGNLVEGGWGSALGYPGIVLSESGADVKGLIFTSDELANQWKLLDDFEGDGYVRRTTTAILSDETTVQVQVYTLNSAADFS